MDPRLADERRRLPELLTINRDHATTFLTGVDERPVSAPPAAHPLQPQRLQPDPLKPNPLQRKRLQPEPLQPEPLPDNGIGLR